MEEISVCDTKVIYDSEFEAQVGVAKTEWVSGEEFMYYPCNRHYHIAHKDPEKRRGVGKSHWRCPKCKQITPKAKSYQHRCKIVDKD